MVDVKHVFRGLFCQWLALPPPLPSLASSTPSSSRGSSFTSLRKTTRSRGARLLLSPPVRHASPRSHQNGVCCRLFAVEMEARGQCLFIRLFVRRFDVAAVKKNIRTSWPFSASFQCPYPDTKVEPAWGRRFFLSYGSLSESKSAFYYFLLLMFLCPEPQF